MEQAKCEILLTAEIQLKVQLSFEHILTFLELFFGENVSKVFLKKHLLCLKVQMICAYNLTFLLVETTECVLHMYCLLNPRV